MCRQDTPVCELCDLHGECISRTDLPPCAFQPAERPDTAALISKAMKTIEPVADKCDVSDKELKALLTEFASALHSGAANSASAPCVKCKYNNDDRGSGMCEECKWGAPD